MGTITFGGYPITYANIDNECLLTCKGLTGTLSQLEKFVLCDGKVKCKFGSAKIRKWGSDIKIDCLTDTREQLNFLYDYFKNINDKNEEQENIK